MRGRSGVAAPPAGNGISSGYYEVYWTDAPGYTLNEDTTYSWTWDGSCATDGSASADWWGQANPGWYLVSGSNGLNTTLWCSRYIGNSWSQEFRTNIYL